MVAGKRDRQRPNNQTGEGGRQAPPPIDSPWRIRYAEEILERDLGDIGHAALKTARKAINDKLTKDPHKYGGPLRRKLAGLLRIKRSHIRVVYHIEDSGHEVWVLVIGDRVDVYDDEDAILERLDLMKDRVEDERKAIEGTRPSEARRGSRQRRGRRR